MSKIREHAASILQDIPDDKMVYVVEMLNGIRGLYARNEKSAAHETARTGAMGIFSKYANPKLIPLEKEAWGEAVRDKHAAN